MKIKNFVIICSALALSTTFSSANADNVVVESGNFTPSWENLRAWECPEWFKDAKFGIWAHWGPQCQAEDGDWYARFMYAPGSGQYNYHVANFGNPNEYGLKELCRDWKAANWNPEELIALYKSVGARYFFTLGQHHDNFDLWDSPYQEWNSVNIGPQRDIVGEWAQACKANGLPLGVSMHGSHAWTWLELSQQYDGNLTKEDGVGQWWEGYDPQELYAQRHTPSTGYLETGTIHSQWDWGNGASQPSEAYKQKFLNRVLQCINTYNPDMLYFDDTVLPFYGCDEKIGLDILAHYYNHRAAQNPDGEADVVVMGKILNDMQKDVLLWDVERGIPDRQQPFYWQTCTCLGEWHYNQNVYKNNSYKTAPQVINMLVDIASKNGNMLLSVPIKADGTIDEHEREVLAGIKAWMDQNSRSIYGTRPWKTFGEGPLAEAMNPLSAQGFNEGINYSAQDVRYNAKPDTLFATIMRWPAQRQFTFECLGRASQYFSGEIRHIELLGYEGEIAYELTPMGLTVTLPDENTNAIAPVFAISFVEGTDTPMTLSEIIALYRGMLSELKVGANTGDYSKYAVADFEALLDKAMTSPNADEAANEVRKGWKTLLSSGVIKAGNPAVDANTDCTIDFLIERSYFTRTAETKGNTRFGKPEYWTVENFCIPTSSEGTKEGLDRFSGRDALMLGVWNDREGADPSLDLSNARIYRKISLEPGRYFFGATFNTVYNLGTGAYMFVVPEITDTYAIPAEAIAYARLNEAAAGNTFWGLSFVIEQPQEVYVGFQADLTGAATQEFRADQVRFLKYDSNVIPEIADRTLALLIESSNFSRTADTQNTRFGTPEHWTVENFKIPNGADGTKNGIDSYPGYNCLMLGVWNDSASNTEGTLANARIYRHMTLAPGKWSFEAVFQTKYGLNDNAWMFASQSIQQSDKLPQNAIATYQINRAGENDGVWHGLEFTLDAETDMYLGFQANLLAGSSTQEFRVKEVRLIYDENAGLQNIVSDKITFDGPAEYYTPTGMRLPGEPTSGIYIERRGSSVTKHAK